MLKAVDESKSVVVQIMKKQHKSVNLADLLTSLMFHFTDRQKIQVQLPYFPKGFFRRFTK